MVINQIFKMTKAYGGYVFNGVFFDGRQKTLEKYGIDSRFKQRSVAKKQNAQKPGLKRSAFINRRLEKASKNCRSILDYMDRKIGG